MDRNRLLLLISLVAIVGLVLAAPAVWAQRGGAGGGQGFQYVVKFICGEVDDNDVVGLSNISGHGQFLAAGEYFTVINVHNPNETPAYFGQDWFKKIVTDYFVTVPQTPPSTEIKFVAQKPTGATKVTAWVNQDTLGDTIGTLTPPRQVIKDFSLSRDEAAQVNCSEIRDVLQSVNSAIDNADVLKGFVVIFSKLRLDVTAVYSACEQGAGTDETLNCTAAETINVQRIEDNGIAPPAGIGLPSGFPQTNQVTTGQFQYSIKFLCGEIHSQWQTAGISGLTGANRFSLGPGEYFTDINIHNPNARSVKVNKKMTMDDPVPEVHGPLVSPELVTLDVDDAIQINCREIRSRLNKPFPTAPPSEDAFIQGYVVLFSRHKLDIVTAYTVCPSGDPGLNCNSGALPVTSLEVRQGKDKFLTSVLPPSSLLPPLSVSMLGGRELRLEVRPGRLTQLALQDVRLQIYTLSGQPLYDSGFTTERELSWQPLLGDRPLANGVYLYVVSLRDVFGKTVRKVGKFVYLR